MIHAEHPLKRPVPILQYFIVFTVAELDEAVLFHNESMTGHQSFQEDKLNNICLS